MSRWKRRSAPVSSLRARLNERLKAQRDEDYVYPEHEPSGQKMFLPLAVLYQMHRHLAVKITVAVVIIFLAGLFSTGRMPWAEPLLKALSYTVNTEMDLAAFSERAVPAFRHIWSERRLPSLNVNGGDAHIAPIKGEVRGGYGVRENPQSGVQEMSYGIDLAAPAGTPVTAVLPGTVEAIIVENGYHTVILAHEGDWQTLYSGLASVAIKEGDRVAAKDLLGSLGGLQYWEEPHLHFELRLAGRPVEPPADWVAGFTSDGD